MLFIIPGIRGTYLYKRQLCNEKILALGGDKHSFIIRENKTVLCGKQFSDPVPKIGVKSHKTRILPLQPKDLTWTV